MSLENSNAVAQILTKRKHCSAKFAPVARSICHQEINANTIVVMAFSRPTCISKWKSVSQVYKESCWNIIFLGLVDEQGTEVASSGL